MLCCTGKDKEPEQEQEFHDTASYTMAIREIALYDDIVRLSDTISVLIQEDDIIEVKKCIYQLAYDYGEIYRNDFTCTRTGGFPACPDSVMIDLLEYVETFLGANIDSYLTVSIINSLLAYYPNLKGTRIDVTETDDYTCKSVVIKNKGALVHQNRVIYQHQRE